MNQETAIILSLVILAAYFLFVPKKWQDWHRKHRSRWDSDGGGGSDSGDCD